MILPLFRLLRVVHAEREPPSNALHAVRQAAQTKVASASLLLLSPALPRRHEKRMDARDSQVGGREAVVFQPDGLHLRVDRREVGALAAHGAAVLLGHVLLAAIDDHVRALLLGHGDREKRAGRGAAAVGHDRDGVAGEQRLRGRRHREGLAFLAESGHGAGRRVSTRVRFPKRTGAEVKRVLGRTSG
jgi:hypothetical protein